MSWHEREDGGFDPGDDGWDEPAAPALAAALAGPVPARALDVVRAAVDGRVRAARALPAAGPLGVVGGPDPGRGAGRARRVGRSATTPASGTTRRASSRCCTTSSGSASCCATATTRFIRIATGCRSRATCSTSAASPRRAENGARGRPDMLIGCADAVSARRGRDAGRARPRPHPVLARLREPEPVSWIPALDGWLVTRHDLALQVMRDAATFTVDDPRFSTARVIGASMLSLDGEQHARNRAPFVGPFRPGAVRERFAAPVAAEAERLVAGAAARRLRRAATFVRGTARRRDRHPGTRSRRRRGGRGARVVRRDRRGGHRDHGRPASSPPPGGRRSSSSARGCWP